MGFLFALFGSSRTLPSNTRELLNCWSRPSIRKRLKKTWMAWLHQFVSFGLFGGEGIVLFLKKGPPQLKV